MKLIHTAFGADKEVINDLPAGCDIEQRDPADDVVLRWEDGTVATIPHNAIKGMESPISLCELKFFWGTKQIDEQ